MPLSPQLLYVAWILALAGTLGSLFFAEVMGLPPCTLCWYQRICMYPLAMLLPVGILLRDPRVAYYALPFAVIGLGISVYHNLVYYHVIPEELTPCTEGVSCSERQIEWFGFVTIPALAMVSFAAIGVCLWAHAWSAGRERT